MAKRSLTMMIQYEVDRAKNLIENNEASRDEVCLLSKLIESAVATIDNDPSIDDLKSINTSLCFYIHAVAARIGSDGRKKALQDRYSAMVAKAPSKLQQFIALSPSEFIKKLDSNALIESSMDSLFDVILTHIKDHEGKSSKWGEIGGLIVLPDKQPFQADYREERLEGGSRANNITALLTLYPDSKASTLMNWAKEADKEDGFMRKAGRKPKING